MLVQYDKAAFFILAATIRLQSSNPCRSNHPVPVIQDLVPDNISLCRSFSYWQVSSIFAITPIKVPFSKAAATLSLSASCLLTSSAVLCVPSLIRTSIRNRGGRDCSRRTRTPRPMTVAKLQCVIVGVISTVTVRRGESGTLVRVGLIEMSGRDTTANAPNEIGCSGSEMVEMRSRRIVRYLFSRLVSFCRWLQATYHIFLVHRLALPIDHRLHFQTPQTSTG